MLKLIKKHRLFLAFAAIVGFLWSWLWFVRASRITDNNFVAYLTISVCYITVVCVSAAVFTSALRYLKRSYKRDKPERWLPRAIVVWALAEAFTAWFITFIWMGRNGSLDNTLPFGSLTPFAMYTPLRFLSRFVGFYGLSAIIVIGIAGVALKRTRRLMPAYWLTVLVLTGLAWQLYKTPTQSPIKATIVAETLDTKLVVDSQDSRLIVLPEYGLDDPLNPEAPPRFAATPNNYSYVGSKQSLVAAGHTNNLIFGSNERGILATQPKNRLIPNGEYLPYGIEAATYFVSPNTYTDFQARRAVVRGTKPIQPFRVNQQLVVGAEVCSSIMSTRDYRQLVKKGATVLTNSASLEIFEGSRLYAWQDQGFATFMAVANARPFLQSTNNWPAMAVNQNGRIIAKTTSVNQVQVSIQPNTARTPYSYLGEWVAVIGGLLVGYEVWQRFRARRR